MKNLLFILIIFISLLGACNGEKKSNNKKEKQIKKIIRSEKKEKKMSYKEMREYLTNKKNYSVHSDFVKYVVNQTFKSYEANSNKVKKVLNNYFGKVKYKVIMKEKLGYNKEIIYFAVEEYSPETMYNTVKKGIFVREDGKIKGYIDPNLGIYTLKEKVIDFKKIGFKNNEVKYFVIIFDTKSLIISLCLLDNYFNNITSSNTNEASLPSFRLYITKERNEDKSIISISDLHFITKEKFYKKRRRYLLKYRIKRKQKRTAKSAAIKKEFERLKKAGLVEEE